MEKRIIETFPAGVAKNKPSNMATPKSNAKKGLGNTQAVENQGGQLSGVKKKRMTPVSSIKNHS